MRIQNTNFYIKLKIKKQFLFLVSFLIFLTSTSTILSSPSYIMSIVRSYNSLDKTIELNIFIESEDESFELTSYQCALNIDGIVTSKRLKFNYVNGSSELINKPNIYVGIDKLDGEMKLTFVSYIGKDIITKQKKMVGKFLLERIEKNEFDIQWNFDGVISTIITGNSFSNITNYSKHTIKINEIVEKKEDLVFDYGLSQNYPNPFNPTTKVKVTIKDEGNASLVVYNLLGEKIIDVFSGHLVSGNHEFNIDASDLTSGVYIYRLTVNNKYSDFKKMNLIK
ncbi:MAG: T9SS type A sorting domain-containing protein [Melioribacteraceae bacterium]